MSSGRAWFERAQRWLTVGPETGLDVRVYRLLTLLGTVTTLLLIIPFNLLAGLTPLLNVVVFVFGLVFAGLHVRARRGEIHPLMLSVLMVLTTDVCFFAAGGLQGTAPLWLVVGAVLLSIFFAGRTRAYALVLLGVNTLALVWIDYRFSALAIPFGTRLERTLDFATGLPISVIVSALAVGVVVDGYRLEHRRLDEANRALERSLAEVKTLRGLLPICGWCKRIRNEQGRWGELEKYVEQHTEAAISHGICPDCMRAHFPEP